MFLKYICYSFSIQQFALINFFMVKKLIYFVLACSLSGMLTSCHKKQTPNPDFSSNRLQVEVFVAKADTISNIIQVPGSILPNEQVILKTEIPGRITMLNFTEGSAVHRGTLLVQIDDSEYKAELKKYEAQLKLAMEDESRKKELLSMKGVSQEVYDLAFTKREELLADIDLVKSKIRKSGIIAPFDGIVGLRYVSSGAFLSNGDVIATLVQINPVKIEFSIPEKYASMITVPMEISFTVSESEDAFKASVYAIEPMIDPASRTLRVRARTENRQHRLVPGSFANLTIDMEEIEGAIMVPTQVIIPSLNSQNVYLIENGTAVLREVETGIQNNSMIQITAGVSSEDTLVMTGLLALRDKMPVQVTKVHISETVSK
jgi:membrane fusion protein, multidrug efflux system